jgi:hypothetical protein
MLASGREIGQPLLGRDEKDSGRVLVEFPSVNSFRTFVCMIKGEPFPFSSRCWVCPDDHAVCQHCFADLFASQVEYFTDDNTIKCPGPHCKHHVDNELIQRTLMDYPENDLFKSKCKLKSLLLFHKEPILETCPFCKLYTEFRCLSPLAFINLEKDRKNHSDEQVKALEEEKKADAGDVLLNKLKDSHKTFVRILEGQPGEMESKFQIVSINPPEMAIEEAFSLHFSDFEQLVERISEAKNCDRVVAIISAQKYWIEKLEESVVLTRHEAQEQKQVPGAQDLILSKSEKRILKLFGRNNRSPFFLCSHIECEGAFCLTCKKFFSKGSMLTHTHDSPTDPSFESICFALEKADGQTCPKCLAFVRIDCLGDSDTFSIACPYCDSAFCYDCGNESRQANIGCCRRRLSAIYGSNSFQKFRRQREANVLKSFHHKLETNSDLRRRIDEVREFDAIERGDLVVYDHELSQHYNRRSSKTFSQMISGLCDYCSENIIVVIFFSFLLFAIAQNLALLVFGISSSNVLNFAVSRSLTVFSQCRYDLFPIIGPILTLFLLFVSIVLFRMEDTKFFSNILFSVLLIPVAGVFIWGFVNFCQAGEFQRIDHLSYFA